MLVAACRLSRRGKEGCNFEAVFKEYEALSQAEKTADRFTQIQAMRGFERLLDAMMISYVDDRQARLLCRRDLQNPIVVDPLQAYGNSYRLLDAMMISYMDDRQNCTALHKGFDIAVCRTRS